MHFRHGSRMRCGVFVRVLDQPTCRSSAIQNVATVFAVDPEGRSGPVSFETFTALQERRDIFQSLGAIRESQERVSIGKRSLLMSVAGYTPDVGDVFPFPARRGVTFSHRVRFAQFAANVDPAGTALRIDNAETLVAGAMPYWLEGLYRGRVVDLWVPLADSGTAGRSATDILAARPPQSGCFSCRGPGGDRRDQLVRPRSHRGDRVQRSDTGGGQRDAARRLPPAAGRDGRVSDRLRERSRVPLDARLGPRARDRRKVAIGARRSASRLRQPLIDRTLIAVLGGAAGIASSRPGWPTSCR